MFPLHFNWMSKGYKTAVSLSSSLLNFVVGSNIMYEYYILKKIGISDTAYIKKNTVKWLFTQTADMESHQHSFGVKSKSNIYPP